MGQRGHPGRDVTVMYAAWTLATLAVAGYGLATASWQLMIACFVFNALEVVGTIVWATLKQRHVPASMLGRVSSLDWLVSIGLYRSHSRDHHRRSPVAGQHCSVAAALERYTLGALSFRQCAISRKSPKRVERERRPRVDLLRPPALV